MTQLEAAKKGIVTEQMAKAAELEGIRGEELRQKIASGEVVLPSSETESALRTIRSATRSRFKL